MTQRSPRSVPITFWGGERGGQPLQWDRVEWQLDSALTYWFSTVSSDGVPQPRPVWGLWHDGRLMLTVGSTTAWGNLRGNQNVSVNLVDSSEVVILEGVASTTPPDDPAVVASFLERYNTKYRWDMPPEDMRGVIVVEPRKVMAWVATPLDDKGGGFPRAAGKWIWDD